MQAEVLINGLYNHETCKNYKSGRQMADKVLERLAKNKMRDGEGRVMVRLVDETEGEKAIRILSEERGDTVNGSPKTMPNQLDPDTELHVKAHRLFAGEGFSFAALTRSMGGDSLILKEVNAIKGKFEGIFDSLKSEGTIVQSGKQWLYANN